MNSDQAREALERILPLYARNAIMAAADIYALAAHVVSCSDGCETGGLSYCDNAPRRPE